jgi:hypothetical protein
VTLWRLPIPRLSCSLGLTREVGLPMARGEVIKL